MEKLNPNVLISIIVPVYNVEQYLGRCVDSLIGQTYKNIEIILVDDGAKDRSGQICDEYALKDERIIVIHKENGGLSDARNAGIKVAKGAFIGFVDSDDYVAPCMYEELIACLTETDSDIAMCRYIRFKGDRCTECLTSPDECVEMNTLQALENIYSDDGEVYTVAWNKLYKREVIADIRYPVKRINEDEFTTYKYIANAKKIVFTQKVLYFYFYNGNSITAKDNYLYSQDIYNALDERIIYLKQRGFGQLEGKIQKQYLDRIISRSRTLYKTNRPQAKNLMVLYRKRYINVKNIVPGIGYRIYNLCPSVYYLLLRVQKRMIAMRGKKVCTH